MRIDREKITLLLMRKDMTAKEVAALAGISCTSIYNAKNGLRCSERMGTKIARALGVDVTEIMEEAKQA